MSKKLLTEGRLVDYFILYMIAKKFISPFKKWDAHRLGIITDTGKRTKKKLVTSEEKNAYTLLDRMIRKIRVFVGDRFFLKLTLAYLLLKEDYNFPIYDNLLNEDINGMSKSVQIGVLERVIIRYNDRGRDIEFEIMSVLKNPETGDEVITSRFGGNITKENEENEKFLGFLNSVFGNLLNGGYKEYEISKPSEALTTAKVSYGPTEIKLETVSNDIVEFGKFYIVFNNKTEAKNFVEMWDELYKEIIYRS